MAFATDEEIRIAHDVLLNGKKTFDDQRVNVIKEDGSCYVQACPGSGKTTALLAKLIILANKMPLPEGKGVCVLTHTNVAMDEIKAKLGSKADILFKYPNFFGTIQTFLHKYVTAAALHYFYGSQITYVDDDVAKAVLLKKYNLLGFDDKFKGIVYAHTVSKRHPIEMDEINALGGVDALTSFNVIKNIGKRKVIYDFQLSGYQIRDLPVKIRSAIKTKRDNTLYNEGKEVILSFRVDWENHQIITDRGPIGMSTDAGTAFLKVKEEMYKEGILSFEEAYDMAFRYIQEKNLDYGSFSDKRFQYLFVDEVQDCDEQQLELIKKIFADDKVIVQRFGDYCQAIFEGEGSDGKDIDELKGDNVHYIHDSNRFGENIAKPLRTLCIEDNHLLTGNDEVYSVKPIIIVYEDPMTVLPKFVELLGSTKIPEMGSYSVLEIANKERREDPLNRVNVKACGWVGKKVVDEQKRFIGSYFPAFERKKMVTKTEGISFDDFIPSNPQGTVKDYASTIIQGILKFLDLCDVKNEGRRYNRTTLLAYLMSVDERMKEGFLTKIMDWAILSVNSGGKNDVCALKEAIYQYMTETLLPLFGKEVSQEANSFFNNGVIQNNQTGEQGNLYHGNGIDIEVATVHSVKGETHAATLYLETAYYGHHESDYLSEQFKGVAYTGSEERILNALKVVYVGMSRPRYLLCVAIQKDRFDNMDCQELREIWNVQNI